MTHNIDVPPLSDLLLDDSAAKIQTSKHSIYIHNFNGIYLNVTTTIRRRRVSDNYSRADKRDRHRSQIKVSILYTN